MGRGSGKGRKGTAGKGFPYPDGLGRLSPDAIGRLRDTYWKSVRRSHEKVAKDRFLDKQPMNLRHLGLIQRVFPRARVLVILRDPRDACLSNFMQNYEQNEAMAPFLHLQSTAPPTIP